MRRRLLSRQCGQSPPAARGKDTANPNRTSAQERDLAHRIEVGLIARERLESGRVDRETERDLRRLVAEGEAAHREFFYCNLKLVVSVAKQYAGRRSPLLDLVQEGNIGLDRAIKKFDHRLGSKFSTYAVWWIRQSVARGLADSGHLEARGLKALWRSGLDWDDRTA